MKANLEPLKQRILAKHKTVHAFCRDNPELKRSTVYQIIAGKYPGNTGKQLERIHAALEGIEAKPDARRPVVTALEAYTVLQETKCAHCRKQDKRACAECRTQTEREAQAMEEYLSRRQYDER